MCLCVCVCGTHLSVMVRAASSCPSMASGKRTRKASEPGLGSCKVHRHTHTHTHTHTVANASPTCHLCLDKRGHCASSEPQTTHPFSLPLCVRACVCVCVCVCVYGTCRNCMYSDQTGPAPMSCPTTSNTNSYAARNWSTPAAPLPSFMCLMYLWDTHTHAHVSSTLHD